MLTRLRNFGTTAFDFILNVRTIGLGLMVIAITWAIFGYIELHGDFNLIVFLGDFYANISAELGSIALTVLIVDGLSRHREKQNRLRDLQEELIREAGSRVNITALTAIDMIRKRGWLFGDGISGHTHAILAKANLKHANLSGADLLVANLKGTNLSEANLSGANLKDADLSNAELGGANLHAAYLRGTNLRGAKLWRANLRNANLVDVNLSGANLGGANLNDAFIREDTEFDENTILPDGSRWSPRRDLTEFGAEALKVVSKKTVTEFTTAYTFVDGVTRRWQHGKGWLDDRDGNPIV